MAFVVVAVVEVVCGLVGAGLELKKGDVFVFKDSLEDSLAAFVVLGLLAWLCRQRCALRASAVCSALGVLYALAKSVVVSATQGRPSLASIGLTVGACAGGVGACLVAAREARAGAEERAKRGGAALDSELTTEYAKLEDGGAGDEKEAKEETSLSMRAILRLLKPYFWPRNWAGRLAVMSTLLFVSLSKVCSVVAPLILARAANAVANGGEIRDAVTMSLAYAGITFAGKVMKECQSLAYLRVQKYAFIDLASDTFQHLHSLSLQWALSKKMGEVVRVTDRGIAGCDTFMKYGVLYIGPSIGEAVAVCVLFYVHFKLWALSALVLASVSFYAALTVKMTLWRKRFRSAMNKSDNAWHDRLTDSLVNFETVKYFTAESYECSRFAEQITDYQKSSVEVQASLSALNLSQQVILCGCLGGAMALSAIAVKHGEASVGGFVAVNVWVINLFAPLNFLGTVYNALITALVDLKNLSELLAQKPLVVDPDPPVDHPGGDGLFERGLAVSFHDVAFRYPGVTNLDAGLKGVSFSCDAGSSLGVCGPTGAGKSTCARLLFRFFDVSAGRVEVGGVDVRSVTQTSLRKLMGVVPQDTVLFNATLDYNIRYGKRGATDLDRDEAAKNASLLPMVRNLQDSWETVVGERGLKLSGGEKQRVAIARLFVKNPPICIFDEATSALDSKTEAEIQGALTALSDTRTAVTIAHRLGTIAKCDAILVLKDGVVAEQGSHDDLLKLGGEYASMWETQSKASQDVAYDETKEGL